MTPLFIFFGTMGLILVVGVIAAIVIPPDTKPADNTISTSEITRSIVNAQISYEMYIRKNHGMYNRLDKK